MTHVCDDTVDPHLDLVLERVVDIAPEVIYQAWTRPELLPKWFSPKPWTVGACSIDLRPGGKFYVEMKSPDGQGVPCNGCYLELIENRRIVWTDSLTAGFRPSSNPFMSAIITMEPQGKGTKYKVIVRHANEETRKRHEEMGFHSGWSQCLDQLVAMAKQ